MAALVSVIIPAYNAARFLGSTLESALQQSHRTLEVIIVDDGSTDGTAELVATMARQDPRISLYRQDRYGVAAARNLGISRSRGDWVAFLDADDLWHPEKIAEQVLAFASSPAQVAVVYSWTRFIDEAGNPVGELKPRWQGDVFVPLALCNFIGHSSAPLIRRTCLEELGGYRDQFFREQAQGCEDWDLYLRLSQRFAFKLVPRFLVDYRIVQGGMSRQHLAMERSYRLMIKQLKAEVPDLPGRLKRWSASTFYQYLSHLARRNGAERHARCYALRSYGLNPVRWASSVAPVSRRAARLLDWFTTRQAPPRLDRAESRWDGRTHDPIYDGCEERMILSCQTWWETRPRAGIGSPNSVGPRKGKWQLKSSI